MGAGGRRLERRLSLGDYKKAVSWSNKYLVAPPGAKIWGGGEELWSADLSKLQIRARFASGRHGRVYSGRYNGREVAIKMVSQPEEDATLAAELERQFAFEVALLLRLRHHNIVSPLAVYLFNSKASKLMNDEPRQAKVVKFSESTWKLTYYASVQAYGSY